MMCVHLHTSIFSGGADARAPECGMENLCLFLDEVIRAVVTQTGERGAMVGLALKLLSPLWRSAAQSSPSSLC